MQLRFVKDLAVGLIIIFLLAYVIRLATVNEKNKQIRAKSIYTNESVSDTLKTRIMAIESSIQDRQNFVFAISKDPLRQGNIIKDRFDRTKEWLEMLRNTFRATGDDAGKALMSMKDLALSEALPQLRQAGVHSLKIEGRKKSPLYVAAVTALYRGLLDGSLSAAQRRDAEPRELRHQEARQKRRDHRANRIGKRERSRGKTQRLVAIGQQQRRQRLHLRNRQRTQQLEARRLRRPSTRREPR